MKVLAITGSMKVESRTKKATEIVIQACKEAAGDEITIEHLHLATFPLPLFDGRSDISTYPENVHTLLKKVEEADGLILASPEYHGSLTGALKNALDFVGGRSMEGKIVAILATLGGAVATNTVNTLNQICRNLHAFPLPLNPSVPRSYEAYNADGSLKDEKIHERLEALGQLLVRELKKDIAYKVSL
ncbi:NADPH-dependent FMN reductase [Bacillus horti]|uniref:NAD(P)H-dependent FMN reductase n=1 Tax=Caldalkalibacillus horti TaxID=77523 RepID=A0ABT9W4B0_9BACI|nr:NAD(P)H-dependent oxidoreductase [Bacillus horti]MDQ0168082.1 NAD(P)H-dependent FMN reductase [Bacillus horti]